MSNVEKCNTQAAIWCEKAKLLNVITNSLIYEKNSKNTWKKPYGAARIGSLMNKEGEISYYSHSTTDKDGTPRNVTPHIE